ncbi:MAG: hypothetical protein B7Z75_10825 [Acidocella sp. 20-57-95]|nr:MAG: hypothetical protein B7Z75_10825 [Acidocella sp. 20-57-95]HQT63436.1 bifunctional DNA primase/polymerase [Acidocella sp.]
MTPEEQVTLAHAFECTAKGWALFPVGLTKAPRTPNGHKDASTDHDRIKAMHIQYGFALIGIATGERSNLAVLDIDRQHNGLNWWQANRHRLPDTRTHRTRSGGLHLYFQHKAGLRCSTARIAPGIDVKAEGGSIIYWPAKGLPVLSEAPLAVWPEWLVLPPHRDPTQPPMPVGQNLTAYITGQLYGLIRTVVRAPPGQRNASLFWAASRVAEIVAQGHLVKPYAEAVLIESACRAGLSHTEAARTIASAFAAGI